MDNIKLDLVEAQETKEAYLSKLIIIKNLLCDFQMFILLQDKKINNKDNKI